MIRRSILALSLAEETLLGDMRNGRAGDAMKTGFIRDWNTVPRRFDRSRPRIHATHRIIASQPAPAEQQTATTLFPFV